jgi:GNAT superfamily N-acetyltransferase
MGASAGTGAGARPAESADDREAAAEALALAFADDPCWAHLLPDEASRAERLLSYFTAEIDALVPAHRQLWIAGDGAAAAVWAPPGRWRVPLRVTLREAAGMAGVFGRHLPRALRAQLRLESRHPKPGHWYLNYLGVEPRRQGRGLGAALLRAVLDDCDRDRAPAYLEASTERNRALYERHGFDLTDVFNLPGRGGPPVREMWREPAQRA